MRRAYEVLRWIQPFVYGVVALAGYRAWRRNRSPGSGWIFATFGVLGAVALAGRFIPQNPVTALEILQVKFLVLAIALYPYFLFRFTASFRPQRRVIEVIALLLTAAAGLYLFVLPGVPRQGQPRTPAVEAFLLVFALQWVSLSIMAVWSLWAGGRGQPGVTRRRMRTLALGALGLAILIVVAVFVPPTRTHAWYVLQVFTTLFGFLAAGAFIIGLTPPAVVLMVWRRDENDAYRHAIAGLLRAGSPAECGAIVLPLAVRLVGGSAARLVADTGEVLARVDRSGNAKDPLGTQIEVSMLHGRLIVESGPYSPFFGVEEHAIVQSLAQFTDLALERARLDERERKNSVELVRNNELMREFVAIASHDLRTPMTVLKGMASTLRSDWQNLPEPTRASFLDAMVRQSDHLYRIVEDLLTVSKIDAGVIESAPAAVDVGAIVEEILRDLGRTASVDVDIPDRFELIADAEHLRRILSNLITNAFNHGLEPVTITCTAREGMGRSWLLTKVQACRGSSFLSYSSVSRVPIRRRARQARGQVLVFRSFAAWPKRGVDAPGSSRTGRRAHALASRFPSAGPWLR